MLWVQLDVNWVNNPKVARAGIDGAGLHATCLCLAKSLDTDGWIDLFILTRYGATTELVDRLVDLALLERHGDRVRPHDWLDRNPSQAAIAARRTTKQEAGKKGNHDRWSHPGDFDSCPRCHPSSQVVAGCDPTGSDCDPTSSPESESESESESAASDAIRPATNPSERKARLAAAAQIIGERAAQRPGARNPGAVSRSVAAALIADHHQDAYALIATQPAITPAELAEALEPRIVEPTIPTAHLRPVSEILSERPPADRDSSLAEIAALKARRHPSTNGATP